MVWDPTSRRPAIIDPALDFDPQSGRSATQTAERLTVDWLLETHAHADHITALPYLKGIFDAPTAIGERITEVQERFAWLFNLGDDFPVDGSQFDHCFPAGSARELYRSIHRLFVLHDYGTDERGPACQTTIGEQRARNIHLGRDAGEEDYVAMREARDATLPMPVLILPVVQVNIRAGHLCCIGTRVS